MSIIEEWAQLSQSSRVYAAHYAKKFESSRPSPLPLLLLPPVSRSLPSAVERPERERMASSAQRASDRLAGGEKSKVLDEEARRKRLEKRLRQLEQDNVQTDPHADVIVNKALPKFADELKPDKKPATSSTTSSPLFELATKRGKKMRLELTRTRFRKSFAQLTEEEYLQKLKDEDPSVRTYSEVRAKRSVLPPRKFCSVCGFFSRYNCVECGMRFCSLRCRSIHKDTRCLKWTS